jgi:hypothetical protein
MTDQRVSERTQPQVGDRVRGPDGVVGTLVGWHESRTWIYRRVEVRTYAVVELEGGSRRLFPVATVTTTESNDNDAGKGRQGETS